MNYVNPRTQMIVRHTISKYWLVLIFLVLLGSCKENTVVNPPPAYQPPNDVRQILPHSVFKQWCYNFLSDPFDTISGDLFIQTIIDTASYEGIVHYIFTKVSANGFSADFSETVDSMTYVRYSKKEPGHYFPTNPIIMLESPIEVGHQWVAASWDSINNPPRYGVLKIIDIDARIAISGNNYEHAIRVRRVSPDEGNYWYEIFIVPGIGIVSEYFYYELGWQAIQLAGKNF